MENQTRHKTQGAEYFLSMMKQTFGDDNIFAYNLSAFVSAARSITLYMQEQYTHRNGFAEWYCPKQIGMRADRELVFLTKARNEDIHTKTVRTGTTREWTSTAGACIAGEGTPKNEQAGETETEPPTQSGAETVGRSLVGEFEHVAVVEFCEKQLTKLTKLVQECENRFP